jgi:hypothetical protein
MKLSTPFPLRAFWLAPPELGRSHQAGSLEKEIKRTSMS